MLLKVAQLVLQALLPLLERRTLAAERQAEYAERQYLLLRQYLGYSDPGFREVLEGTNSVAEALAGTPDEYSEHGAARDLKAQRLEELRALWYQQHGELLDDDRLMVEYDRLYSEAEGRMDADVHAEVRG